LLRRQSLYPSELRAPTDSFSLHGRVEKHQCEDCADVRKRGGESPPPVERTIFRDV
jgi:hypothetical protein